MPTYYVGPGGNDGNTGLSWAQRKLTLNGAEDIPVAAGDTVYVGPGVYREQLQTDINGVAGSPITYIGDYTGTNTDGVGGVVRITGSNDDVSIARNHAILNYRTHRAFRGLKIDMCTLSGIESTAGYLTVENCHLSVSGLASGINIGGATTNITVKDSYICSGFGGASAGILFFHLANVDNANHLVENCVLGGGNAIYISRIGGITIRNCLIAYGGTGVIVVASPSAGQFVTVNNSVVYMCASTGLRCAPADGSLVSDYNNVYSNNTNYNNVAVGVHDVSYDPLLDTRWFFEAVNGGRMATPFDLGQWSQLIDLAGLNPPATDLRRTGLIGAARERGPLEYDTTLLIKGGAGGRRTRLQKHGV